MAEYGSGLVRISSSWTNLKAIVISKNLNVQYDESSTAYDIFTIDGSIIYYVTLFKVAVPDSNYNQTQNDLDKADFETNYKNITTNRTTSVSAAIDGYATTTTSPTLIAGSDGSSIRTVKTDGYGRIVTIGLGIAGTPAGGVFSIQGVSGGQAIPITGTVIASNTSVSATGSAPPASASYIGGSVTTSAPIYTTGQMSALSLTTSGLLRIDGSLVTQPIAGTNSDNTTNSTTKLPVLAARANTSAPSWTDGYMAPLSVDTAGNLRVSGSITVSKSTTSSITSVASSTSNTSILASNVNRVLATIFNAANRTMYVALGSTASLSAYSLQIMPNSYWELPITYTGAISAVWGTGVSGNCLITDLSQ